MKITFKLYATLTDLLPAGAKANAVEIDIPDDTTLNNLIDKYQVPRDLAHLVLVNGVFIGEADRDNSGTLTEGDTLAIWPPVAGG
ncbi:MAG: MoaD/ThiS family protein [Granulosicoccus sp.]|nr:MoaD/ThiS family protein [Granulosicoccus sp.]